MMLWIPAVSIRLLKLGLVSSDSTTGGFFARAGLITPTPIGGYCFFGSCSDMMLFNGRSKMVFMTLFSLSNR